jgi:hypothetical protein
MESTMTISEALHVTTALNSPEEVLKSLPLPPKNLVGDAGKIVKVLVAAWRDGCAGKCANAELTQHEINEMFLVWLRRSRSSKYDDLVINHLVKNLIKMPRPKRSQEVNEEMNARKVITAASKLRGPLAVITGGKIIEAGDDAGDSPASLVETWKSRGAKPRSIINEIMEDISRKLLLVDNAAKGNGQTGVAHDVLD